MLDRTAGSFMLHLVSHEIHETIYESWRTLVYRGRRSEDGRVVIVKTHRLERPPPEAIARLRREFAMGRQAEGPGVIRYLDVEAQGGTVVLISEDFGALDLGTQLPAIRGDVDTFLAVALQLAEGLSSIHDQDLIHKDIKPANIVMNPDTRLVKIIDFGLASEIVRERRGPRGPARMEGSIAYMSPEQTGRMNRTIDHRSDLYSLGVTFYEMLCGQRPFSGDDSLELIHCHIAKQPTPPHQIDADVPRVLSDITMKLLAKNAEERYQSARGLRADLLRCERAMHESGRLVEFELGADDRSGTLQVSERLYGREPHKRSLLDAFDRASRGGRELVLVGGPAGVGKSALIAEMHRPMTERRGYFISGKGDVVGRNVPYAVLLQAFESLLRELLTESESRLERWRGWLVEALGPNAGLMTEVLPELALIIGEHSAPPQVGPGEAQRRFDQTFLHFVGVFARAEHPLVLFLDDLQWADSATCRMLRQLLTISDCVYLLIVGAYRDDEVGRAHALTLTTAEIREAGERISEIALEVLGVEDVTQLLADTLGCGLERALPLAALVHDKTLGNPFFIGELLRALHTDDQLRFEDGEWRWDEDEIQRCGVSTNVVGLLVDKVRLLSEPAQESLRLAACLGTTFELRPLALLSDSSIAEIARGLNEAIRAGLVQPLGQLYKQAELGMDEGAAAQYRFIHDRVQEAAYSLLPEHERPAVHWQVGKILLVATPAQEREARVFDIVNQLDQGMALAEGRSERAWLARLNLRAGRRAAESIAPELALVYLRCGIELLGEDGFTREYELALALHTEACAAAQASDDLSAMDRYADLVLANARSLLDRLPVYETRIYAYNAKRLLPQAMSLGLDVLGLLGIHFPAQPTATAAQAPIMDILGALAERGIEELAALPIMDDPEKRAAMRIMVALVTPVFTSKQSLYPVLIAEMVKSSLEHGNAPESAVGYSNLGAVCCMEGIADYEAARRLGQLALLLIERLGAQHLRPNIEIGVHAFIRARVAPLATVCAPLRAAALEGLSNGNLEYGGHCLHTYGLYSFFAGRELEALEADMATHIERLARQGQQTSINWMNAYRQSMRNLLGYEDEPNRLRGQAYDEEVTLSAQVGQNDQLGLFHAHLNAMIVAYLFRDYERAMVHADTLKAMWDQIPLSVQLSLFYGYDALLLLAVAEEATEEGRTRIMERVEADLDKLRRVADAAPMNYRHRWLLVEAERHRVEGRAIEAMDAYDEAIASATSNGFHNDAALANELAAEFWLARNKVEFATVYARAARYEYERWGAKAKVADLDDRYQDLAQRLALSLQGTTSTESSTSDTVRMGEAGHLDMGSVFKATRVLSEEMDVRQVVTSLMKIVIENAGAHRGYLLLDEAGTLTIQAAGSVDVDSVVVERSDLGTKSTELGLVLSEAIVRYVVRTGKPVVLHDAVNSGLFTRDPHIRRGGVRSVLCMPFSAPMMSQRSSVGVLYLENSDTVNAFSHDRVKVLKLITAQAAISLENARLYEDLKRINATLEELVAERTKELRDAQRALVRASRRVGQAEVAEDLLHNAGNLLNSLTVSAGMLRDAAKLPEAQLLGRVVERLRSLEHELSRLLASSEQGPKLLKLLESVGDALSRREQQLQEIASSVGRVVDEFVQVLHKHDEYLTEVAVVEAFPLGTLLDDAIASAGVAQHAWLRLRKDYGRQPTLHSDQYGLERLLATLLCYLGEVAAAATGEPATLTVTSRWTGRAVEVTLGLGRHADDRAPSAELFQQRSTLRPDLPTLHDCANAAAKLGGALQAYVGATAAEVHFVLTLDAGTPSDGDAGVG
ncbi:AAA family ATPase [Haliangium sp.]|uniref:AAA family ATPase n=1 Tax=Haliangium sp. TaxID=2663208 RepID=UPI003D0CF311